MLSGGQLRSIAASRTFWSKLEFAQPNNSSRRGRNKRTRVLLESVQAGGEMPLEYMLRVMRDPNAPAKRRDEMAKAAAPFLHSKLASIESSCPHGKPLTTGIEVSFVVPKRRLEDN